MKVVVSFENTVLTVDSLVLPSLVLTIVYNLPILSRGVAFGSLKGNEVSCTVGNSRGPLPF